MEKLASLEEVEQHRMKRYRTGYRCATDSCRGPRVELIRRPAFRRSGVLAVAEGTGE